ncbi:hypothetical protein KCU89_g73, partial [Aureobasidium melanogenum]
MLVKLILACVARMWLADNILLRNHKTLIGRPTPIIFQLRPPLVRVAEEILSHDGLVVPKLYGCKVGKAL